MVCPPSMTTALPTTKPAPSEHSQTTALAISSGLPMRPIGSSEVTFARKYFSTEKRTLWAEVPSRLVG